MSRRASSTGTAPADWRVLGLHAPGRSLIEASAGTGKTWTIALLYLRLILEQGLSPRQIVVATFTDAAAQELRERLRGRLTWAERQAGIDAAEPGIDAQWLHARWQADAGARDADLQRLRLALAEMDVAPVGTLHGLCRRILSDHPFACGVPFVRGEMVSGSALREEIVTDIWRCLQQDDDDAPWLRDVRRFGAASRASLDHALGRALLPGMRIEPARVPDMRARIAPEWAAKLRALTTAGVLRSNARLLRGWRQLADWIETPTHEPQGDLLGELETLNGSSSPVLRAAQADPAVVAAVAFTREVALPFVREYVDAAPLVALAALAARARELVAQRLAQRNEMRFDDLLTRVHDALHDPLDPARSRHLADVLFQAWPVALVDEFQDTDSVQYGILDRIHRDADGKPRGRLVMIGDPKQAIYRFRGGDIDAYQDAAAQAGEAGRLSLGVNHRSARALVAALNEWFASVGGSLSADHANTAIAYQPVTASDRRDSAPYTIGGKPCLQPLVVHWRDDAPESVGERRSLALATCANQIAAMLQSAAHAIGGQALSPSDIAVLLPTAASIRELRDLLGQRGVPCVTSERSSVFGTDLARELQVVLYAVAHHTDAGALRAAMATRLGGASFSQLQQWGEDSASWQPIGAMFRRWHDVWRTRGVQVVVEALIEHIAPRYLATLGGERAVTDLRHLGELLQAQGESRLGAEELLAWFAAQRDDSAAAGDEAAEAAQLRIESDRARVRIMTLHASKGLEFPIVLLPLMWDHGERRDAGPYVVHEHGQRVVRYDDEACGRELADLQDERFRILYVAMTRAIHACHLYALPPQRPARKNGSAAQGSARSALDVLLARMQPAPGTDGLARQTAHVQWLSAPTWASEDYCAWRPAATEAPLPRSARTARPRPAAPLAARHSFTTLTQHHAPHPFDPGTSAGDESDIDDAPLAIVEADDEPAPPAAVADAGPHPRLLALAAIRGADFGNALHAIFEHRVVGVSIDAQRVLVETCLDEAGVRRREIERAVLVDALVERVQAALDAPLGATGAPMLRLDDLPAADLRAEMAFHFPLERASMALLREACARHGEHDLIPAGTQGLSGLMTGKIDLVFQHEGRCHLLDYKGNYLGDRLADYSGARLREKMQDNQYRFQALLYCVALDRYLRQRLGAAYRRDAHLGECFYLFVRAAGLGAGAGIWRQRFPDALLDDVGAVFDSGIATREPMR